MSSTLKRVLFGMGLVDSGKVEQATITGNEIAGIYRTDKERFQTYAPSQYDGLANQLIERGILVTAKAPTQNLLVSFLSSWAPILLLIGVWIFFIGQIQRGGNTPFSFGKSKAKLSSSSQKKVTFKDVAGVDEASEELHQTPKVATAMAAGATDRVRDAQDIVGLLI